MSLLASPAIGCQLRLVEVQVGDDVETYNATTFGRPLEFSLQGQRSLGSELGTLLLMISAGSKKMLSIRLNDLLNHPDGTEETITIDKHTRKLCVRLPNLEHTLRVWFEHSRDFLVSVCILRKTGFTMEESSSSALAKPDTQLGRNAGPNTPAEQVGSGSPRVASIITTLAAMTGEASEGATTSRSTIFDEVLDRLNRAGKEPDALSDSGVPARSENHISKEDTDSGAPEQIKHSVAEKPPLPRRHHGYFTRSFSLAARRRPDGDLCNVNKEQDLQLALADSISSSFDSRPSADFRNLMPHRRSLPFLVTKQHASKKRRINQTSASDAPNTSINGPGRMETQALSEQSVCRIPEMLTLLMQASILDELETKSSTLYNQYEQDVANRHGDEGKRAAFYLNSLEHMRTSFWLDKLQKLGALERKTWAEW